MELEKAKLRDLTFRKGLNQKKVAELSGLSNITINGIYNGRTTTEETARKIAEVLEVPIEKIQII